MRGGNLANPPIEIVEMCRRDKKGEIRRRFVWKKIASYFRLKGKRVEGFLNSFLVIDFDALICPKFTYFC